MSDRLLTDSELNMLIVTAKQQVKDFYENIGIPQAVKAERERVIKKIDDLVIGSTGIGCIVLDCNLEQWQQLKQDGI